MDRYGEDCVRALDIDEYSDGYADGVRALVRAQRQHVCYADGYADGRAAVMRVDAMFDAHDVLLMTSDDDQRPRWLRWLLDR